MTLTERFWEQKSLHQMNAEEWEALCDGCGKCCLHKLEDEDDGEIYYTDVACKLLDITTCRCNNYSNRLKQVPGCVQLTPDAEEVFDWLPKSCAYRTIKDGKPLPEWHHLVSGNPDSIHKKRQSIRRRAISEQVIEPEEMELHIIDWIE